ncbi:MAG: UDP-N-acetylmuramoyl-tripeptide--D-alanyl-D-alanine ligase [Eubacteriales bacterium]
MEKITLKNLLESVKGTLVGDFNNLATEIHHVELDSRKVKALDVFFAIIGEKHDAHLFIDSVKDGVGFVISKELPVYEKEKFYILVEDTTKALGDLAKWYKNQFDIPFIAVTGSVGKTTTKDMIASVLGAKFQVHKTQGNFNNNIGLPLTLLQLETKHEICVLEMGMDSFGEIDYMANIVKPDYAVITNIGDAHIERLGNREGIRKAKFELLPHISPSGMLFLNGDDPLLSGAVKDTSFTVITVGAEGHNPYSVREIIPDFPYGICCLVETPEYSCKVKVPAMGNHMQYPLLFALAIGNQLEMTQAELLLGVEHFSPSKMRMNLIDLADDMLILDDCYNANPQSMKAAIDILSNFSSQKTIAVLGDMLELGDISQSAHSDLGVYLTQKRIDQVLAIGECCHDMVTAIRAEDTCKTAVHYCDSNDQLLNILWELMSPHTVVLFKASRGMALDLMVQKTVNYFTKEGR